MKPLRITSLLVLPVLPVMAQVPDTGTRHDHRSGYLELGVSANAGFPDIVRPQIELMAKRRGWPVFASGRFGVGIGDWIGNATVFATPQLALHWTRDGDDSWALRLGWVMGKRMMPLGPVECDSASVTGCGALQSTMLGNTLAVERTAYFSSSSNVAWRVSIGMASAWHRYEFHGSPYGEAQDFISPFFDIGLLWTSF